MSTVAQIVQLYYNNIQFLTVGPIVGGLGVTPIAGNPILDFVLTASLYQNRDITSPTVTPGTLVIQFGGLGTGSVILPQIGNGIYQISLPAFNLPTGTYQLVLDAPASPSGFQLHRERQVSLLTAN